MNQVNILHCQSHQEHLEAGRPLGDLLEESPGCWVPLGNFYLTFSRLTDSHCQPPLWTLACPSRRLLSFSAAEAVWISSCSADSHRQHLIQDLSLSSKRLLPFFSAGALVSSWILDKKHYKIIIIVIEILKTLKYNCKQSRVGSNTIFTAVHLEPGRLLFLVARVGSGHTCGPLRNSLSQWLSPCI